MKKGLFIGTMMLALAVSGITLASVNKTVNEPRNLVMDNIEALSQNEGFIISCGTQWGTCWDVDPGKGKCYFTGNVHDYCVNM